MPNITCIAQPSRAKHVPSCGELLVLYELARRICAADSVGNRSHLGAGEHVRPDGGQAAAQNGAAGRGPCRRAGSTFRFQIPHLRSDVDRGAVANERAQDADTRVRTAPARRHIVLLVPDDRIPRRRLQGESSRREKLLQIRSLYLILPAARGGAYRTRPKSAAAIRYAAKVRSRARDGRHENDALGLLHEALRRRKGRAIRERRLQQLGTAQRNEPSARDVLLRVPDILRLLRIFAHRQGRCGSAWIPADGQLQASVSRHFAEGILAALAHIAFNMVYGLCLHSSWRQQMRSVSPCVQSVHYLSAKRNMARRELDVCRMGRNPRNVPGRNGALATRR